MGRKRQTDKKEIQRAKHILTDREGVAERERVRASERKGEGGAGGGGGRSWSHSAS